MCIIKYCKVFPIIVYPSYKSLLVYLNHFELVKYLLWSPKLVVPHCVTTCTNEGQLWSCCWYKSEAPVCCRCIWMLSFYSLFLGFTYLVLTKKHFPILYWNKLIQGGNALWIKYVFLNQAKRLWHFYAKRFMYAFFLVTLHLQLFKDYWLNRKIYIWKNTRFI